MAHYFKYTGSQIDKLINPSRVCIHLVSDYTQVLTLADTWYKLEAPIEDGNAVDFTIRPTPDFDILFTGMDNSEVEFLGNADVSVSGTATKIEFAFFINNILIDKFTAGVTIPSNVDEVSLGTNGFWFINKNEPIDIRVRCTDAGRTLTIRNLKTTLKLIAL